VDDKSAKTKNKNRFRSFGCLVVWMCIGMMLGLIMFEDMAIGIGTGAGMGIALGTCFSDKK
jgi:hypothetical protein